MFDNTDSKFIWKNGEFQKWDDSTVHLMSHTLNYGTGAFEGVRAYKTDKGPAIFRLEDHTQRLFDTAEKIDIKIPYTKAELNNVQKKIFVQTPRKNIFHWSKIRNLDFLLFDIFVVIF